MVKYREFSPKDLFEVMKFVNAVFDTSYKPEVFMNMHNMWSEGFILVKERGKIIGLALAANVARGTTRILLLGVAESHRKRGVGSTLLQKLLLRAAAINSVLVTLEVRQSNSAAIAFYERFGFQIQSIIPRITYHSAFSLSVGSMPLCFAREIYFTTLPSK